MADEGNSEQRQPESLGDLSWIGRRQIQLAALFKTVTTDAREDIKAHPWKYPGYVIYLTAMMMPSPVPHGTAMAALMVGWAKLGLTPGARVLNQRLKDAFNEKAMLKDFAPYIEYKEPPPRFGIRSTKLFWDTLKQNGRDLKEANDHFFHYAFGKKEPPPPPAPS
ncbi:MAG TPA: hypothetical protein VL625_00525 [Patescibacteria group bacterium]|nr:hypothetical protein [Patescibacteria group bacterium]